MTIPFTAPVVDPTITVWFRVVQDGNGGLHRIPVRAELSGGRRGGTREQRRDWPHRLDGEGWRNLATVDAGGPRVRELTLSRGCELVEAGEDGVWCRFAVVLASPESGLAHVRRVAIERG